MCIRGLWPLSNSWERSALVFDEAGSAPLAPGWPDDPDTVDASRARPEVFAGKTVEQVADHFMTVIERLQRRPAVVGHCFGGLAAQMIEGRGSSIATVAVDPAPYRTVLALPRSILKSSWPVPHNQANRRRAVSLTYEQSRYPFANAVSKSEAIQPYHMFAVPASGAPIFQAATANLNPPTQVKVDTMRGAHGPMLIVGGEKDHAVPPPVADAVSRGRNTPSRRPSSSSTRKQDTPSPSTTGGATSPMPHRLHHRPLTPQALSRAVNKAIGGGPQGPGR